MKRLLFCYLSVFTIISYYSQAQQHPGYLTLRLTKGDTLANIYSRTIAITGDQFQPVVYRVSGSSSYVVTNNDARNPSFTETDIYDEQPDTHAEVTIGLNGTNVFAGKSFLNPNASGLLYSEFIWGPIPAKLHEGDTWQHTISQAWELGGPGTQTVKVIALDPQHATITLQREDTSEGFFDHDVQQLPITTKEAKKLKATVTPGTAHWTGYTSFKNGVVISDELLVIRPVTLEAEGQRFSGKQREYMLLNAMPHHLL
ncbi:MAG: hypothetical protein J7623_18870 [Chitinophaga sp.]|uniref:hypothetical protein n=1 Tax=Chitinophaga sp. TaxID=1869181 RepID=UPI001B05E809|nr:hypothetical protein [Chitinophaga sp.]MBO9730712.1 hypothetical protein [Chitinophaga sp.]